MDCCVWEREYNALIEAIKSYGGVSMTLDILAIRDDLRIQNE